VVPVDRGQDTAAVGDLADHVDPGGSGEHEL
jgi:hypothetical protein